MEKRYTWIVRFDVAPEWVADGFYISDARANDMLATALPVAAEQHEIRAAVIAAPYEGDIAREQGYVRCMPNTQMIMHEIRDASPIAYDACIVRSISRAIDFMSAYRVRRMEIRDECIRELTEVLNLISGASDLPDSN